MSTSAQAISQPTHDAERDLAYNFAAEISKRFPYLKCKVTHSFMGEMMAFGQSVAPSQYPWRIKIEHATKHYYKCTLSVRVSNNQVCIATHKYWPGIDREKFYEIAMEHVPVRDKRGHQKVLKSGTPQTRLKRVVRVRMFDLYSPVETERFFTFIEEIFNGRAS